MSYGSLFGNVCRAADVAAFLDAHHYLGRANRGWAWSDEQGVIVFTNPNTRHLPADWLELVRWCLVGEKNGGSRQWKAVSRFLRHEMPHVTTVVSYSDPSQGHTGALYKACNWIAAPTWLSLRPPPSGNGSWDGETVQAVKDRWIFPLQKDARRELVLSIKDDRLARDFADREYRDPPRLALAEGVRETTPVTSRGVAVRSRPSALKLVPDPTPEVDHAA